MATKKKRIFLIVPGVVAFALFAWLLMRPSQPVYDGRSLAEWMAVLGSSNTDEEAHAFAAIEAMGTNALPTIIQFLGRKDSADWRHKATIALLLSGSESQHASIPAIVRLSQTEDTGVRLTAVDALSQLMFSEAAAIPALEIAQTDSDAHVRAVAQEALQRLNGVKSAVEKLHQKQPNL
jgi:HEAT repeat protein